MSFPQRHCLRPYCFAIITVSLLIFFHGALMAGTPAELQKRGDHHDVRLEAKEALACYLEVEKVDPTNADLLVKIARQYRHLMADATSDSEKLRLGNLALGYGQRAAAAGPSNSDAQLSCAISYGKMLPYQPKRDQVAASRLIKDGAERAIKLNSHNDLAWHVLGRWHRNMANMGTITRTLAAVIYEKLPSGSNEEAVRCLKKAIKINPHRPVHYIELGRTFAQMGRKEEARQHLQKGLVMPNVDKDDTASKTLAREELKSLD